MGSPRLGFPVTVMISNEIINILLVEQLPNDIFNTVFR